MRPLTRVPLTKVLPPRHAQGLGTINLLLRLGQMFTWLWVLLTTCDSRASSGLEGSQEATKGNPVMS